MAIDRLSKKSRRLVVEKLPTLNAHWIQPFIPQTWNTRSTINVELKIPDLKRLTCYATVIEAEDRAGDIHTIKLAWRHVVSGPQLLLICPECSRKQQLLYAHRSRVACRRCLNSIYVSQTKNRHTRPRWQQTKHQARRGILPASTPHDVYRTLDYYSR